jgi:RNase P protein component
MKYEAARKKIKSGDLGYGRPANARFNIRYGGSAASVLRSNISVHPRIFPYIFNILFRKFSRRVQNTCRFILPTFANFIGHIICICTKKQMLWVKAISVVALMKHVQAFGYRSESSLPSYMVRKSSNTTIAHSTISGTTVFGTQPVYTAGLSFSRRKIGKPILRRLSSKVVRIVARTHWGTSVDKVKVFIAKQYCSIPFLPTGTLKKDLTYAIL